MNKIWIQLIFCIVFAVGFIQSVNASKASLDNPDIVEAFMDGIALPLMKNHHSPSGTVAVVKDGKMILAKGYGYQNIEKGIPVDPYQTLFRPGSVSKLFTWVAVMQQVEQGKLDLDTDVNTWLKTFQIRDSFPGQPVTLRHIMTHTAGFEDGGAGYIIMESVDRAMPLRDAMKRYQPKRVNPPGAQTAYSNYATALAGLIVANVSGQEFNDYVQKNIFDVLGMKNASFVEPLPSQLNARMAVGYNWKGGKYVAKPFEILSNFAPAGALSATATDMVRLGQALLNGGEYNGGRILREETVKQMLTRNFSHDPRMMGMALGIYETEENEIRLLEHGGDTFLFHSELVIDPQHNFTFFVSFSNSGGAVIRNAIKPALFDKFFPAEEQTPAAPKDFDKRAKKYAGNYVFWRNNFSQIEKLGKLMAPISVQPTANNTLAVSLVGNVSEYVELEKNLFREKYGSGTIAFQEDQNGRITGFVKDGMPFMSTYKSSFYESASFNLLLLVFSIILFVGVFLRLGYQWSTCKKLPNAEKQAFRASVFSAGSNLLCLIAFVIVVTSFGFEKLYSGIPLAFKLWLLLPIVATAAGLYHLFNTIRVWKHGLYHNAWARSRYTVVALCSLFMCWFYYYWNILGFQYLT